MALIEMQADLKETNRLLERLTQVMERLLYEFTATDNRIGVRYGHMAQAAHDPNPDERPSVSFHTDEDTVRQDLLRMAGREEDE